MPEGEARITYLEEYPPRIDDPGLPTKLQAHAESLAAGFAGHHNRALDLFGLICEFQAGASVEVVSERRGDGGSASSGPAYPGAPSPHVSA